MGALFKAKNKKVQRSAGKKKSNVSENGVSAKVNQALEKEEKPNSRSQIEQHW